VIGGSQEELILVDLSLRVLRSRYEDAGRGVPRDVVRLQQQVSAVLGLLGPSISATSLKIRDGDKVSHPAALLGYRDAATRLGCSMSTIERAVREGRLPVVQIGRVSRIDPADLTAFIDAHKERKAS